MWPGLAGTTLCRSLIATVPVALLAEYKGQVHVERHFHFLKDPLFVDALYVQKPERIEALGYVLLLLCLLYSLAERRLPHSVPIPPGAQKPDGTRSGPSSGEPTDDPHPGRAADRLPARLFLAT